MATLPPPAGPKSIRELFHYIRRYLGKVSQSIQAIFNLSGTSSAIGNWKYRTGYPAPASGEVTFNNNDMSLATAIKMSETNRAGTDQSAIFNAVASGQKLYFQVVDNPANWALFIVDSIADSGTFRTIGVTFVAEGAADFSDTDIVYAAIADPSGGGHEIAEDDVPVTQRSVLNFLGSDFDVTDDAGNDATDIAIANDAITNAKMANMSSATFKGRNTGTGDPEDLTAAQMKTLLGYLQNVVEDATPELGGDLYCNLKSIYEIEKIVIDGHTATYSGNESFIDIPSDHTHDHGGSTILPTALWFHGTHTTNRNMVAASGGSLFYASPIIKNEAGVARRLSGLQLLVGNTTYRADGILVQSATGAVFSDVVSAPAFDVINTGSFSGVTDVHSAVFSNLSIGADVALTTRMALRILDSSGSGSLTNQVGLSVAPITKATNNTALLYGTTTVPSGNHGVYQGDDVRNYFNGSMRFKRRRATGAVTFDRTDFLIHFNAAAANVSLPKASDHDGVIFVLKKENGSAGSPTLNLVDAGDSIDGAATLLVTTAKAVQSYGAGNLWMVIWTA